MNVLLALHIISFTAWFAGLFYLPRLFVYHADAEDQISRDRFKVMERRLYKGIMNPAMVATLGFGFWLLALNYDYYKTQWWMHGKLILVAFLVIYHHLCGIYIKHFKLEKNRRSSVYYRFFNEVPTVILIAVVFLALLKPF